MKVKWSEYNNKTIEEKFNIFMSSLSITNKTPDFFVNWNKVENNTKKYELELNTLNYLLGKENIYEEAKKLFIKQPDLLKAIPSLIATRDKNLDLLLIRKTELKNVNLDFKNIDINKINTYMKFLDSSGLLKFLQNNITKNLVDFVYGVETGLDSNARKNRSGTTMESIVDKYIIEAFQNNGDFDIGKQVTYKYAKNTWGLEIPLDKSSRRYDNAIYNKSNNHLYLIETNYYNGGGSKLKSVAGEFSDLNSLISNYDNLTFIWITDGQGWKTAKNPLNEAFYKIEYIFNLKMLVDGFLKDLIL